jgi:hypothetical protein
MLGIVAARLAPTTGMQEQTFEFAGMTRVEMTTTQNVLPVLQPIKVTG